MSIRLNWHGRERAREMIAHGKVRHGAFKLDEEDHRAMLGAEGTDHEAMSAHHLGVDDEKPFGHEGLYRYPSGKEGHVYSRALHGIRNAAHEAGHEDIRDAAGALLGQIKSEESPEERHIVKDGKKWKLYSKDGSKLLGTHPTREEAVKQEEAVKASEAAAAGRSALAAAYGGVELRSLPMVFAELRVRKTPEGPVLHGYASVFNRDSTILPDFRGKPFIERIHPNAFDSVLSRDPDVRSLANHDPNKLLGRTKSGTLKLSRDDVGVPYEVLLPDTQDGRDVAELVSRGDMNGSSFSFTTHRDEWDHSGEIPVRTVHEVRDLFDVGPVTYPAYLDASAALRSLDRSRPTVDRSAELLNRQRIARLRLVYPSFEIPKGQADGR